MVALVAWFLGDLAADLGRGPHDIELQARERAELSASLARFEPTIAAYGELLVFCSSERVHQHDRRSLRTGETIRVAGWSEEPDEERTEQEVSG
jgi:hypothetical protein